MKKKVVLLLQGGGSLGAFQCGVWQVLHSFLQEREYELDVIAGASIGAVNAGLIARHYHDADGGVQTLRQFWRGALATPPLPLLALPGEYGRAWNGLLTGLLMGNGALFRPAYQNWNPVGDMFRFQLPLYDTQIARQTLNTVFGRYRGNAPRLIIGATDVTSGKSTLFDSTDHRVTADMVAASMAIPILFPPVEIDGRYYWDGDMRPNSLVPDVLALLREEATDVAVPDEYLVIVLDMLKPDSAHAPVSAMQAFYRLYNIMLGEKLAYDRQGIEMSNAYIDTLQRLRDAAKQAPDSPLAAAIEDEYRNALTVSPLRVELLTIGRSDQFDYEYVSRDFDYSPDYIDRLIDQGVTEATRALTDYQQKQGNTASIHAGIRSSK